MWPPPLLFDVLTIFPELFRPFLTCGMVEQARRKGLIGVRCTQLRAFTEDRHRSVDDRPYGGGPGMVFKPEPVVRALDLLLGEGEVAGAGGPAANPSQHGVTELILLCPRGERLRQSMLEEWARCSHVIVLCGRYEGIDQRIETARPWRRVSVGDYVLSGGEVPAMVIIEGVTRLVPGVLGHTESAACDSFTDWSGSGGFDHPHYTRPIEYRGATVPEVLLSGNHAEIEKWRAQQRRAKQESTPARPTSDGGACGPPAIE